MHGSVTECLERVKQGESFAQLQIFERYCSALTALANGRLHRGHVVADAEDVVSQVFYDFLMGATEGRFRKLEDRRDLWQLLLALTRRRMISQRRYDCAQKRSNPSAEPHLPTTMSADSAIERASVRPHEGTMQQSVVDLQPNPALATQLQEEFVVRLQQLDGDKLRSIAVQKLAGYSNQEIADKMDCSLRSVERKLSLIRRRWRSA